MVSTSVSSQAKLNIVICLRETSFGHKKKSIPDIFALRLVYWMAIKVL